MALRKTSHGGGGTGAWCAPRTPGATAAWKQRRHLCRDTIEPGWTSSLSLPSLPATRPAPSGPSPGRTPRSSDSFPRRKCLFSPRPEGKGGGGVHRGPPPQSTAWVLEGTRAPRSGGGSPVREGAGRGRKRAGRPRRQGGRWDQGTQPRNPESRTPDVRPGGFWFISISCIIAFWSTNSGADQQHIPWPQQSPVWDAINSPAPFVGTRAPLPIPHQSQPTALLWGNNVQPSSHPPPGDSTRGPSSMIGNRHIYPHRHSSNLSGPAPSPIRGQAPRARSTFGRDLERFLTWDHRLGAPPILQTYAFGCRRGPGPKAPPHSGMDDPFRNPTPAPLETPGSRCASGSRRGRQGALRPPVPLTRDGVSRISAAGAGAGAEAEAEALSALSPLIPATAGWKLIFTMAAPGRASALQPPAVQPLSVQPLSVPQPLGSPQAPEVWIALGPFL